MKYHVIQDTYTSVKAIRKLAADWKIDIIYTNSSVTPVGRFAALYEHIPHIWHIREFGDLDFSLRYIFSEYLSKRLIISSDAVICHAESVRDYHFKAGTKRVYQVYNGAATKDQFDFLLSQRKAQPPHRDFTFAMVSSISPKKGQETAIRAIADLRERGVNAKLLLAGYGKPEYEASLKQLAVDLDIADRVEFTGFMEDPYPLYFASDSILVCSEHEALSRAALEAMSTALPVIGKNSGGTPEIIVPGETGFLYNTFEELADAMAALAQDPDRASRMGLAGWQRAKELFNIEDYAAGVYRVIESVMEKRK